MNPTSDRPVPLPGVLDIAPYIPGRSRATGGVKLHKLSSNETPLGPSPNAIKAFQRAATALELYPDGAASDLREAIGEIYGLDPKRIVCGAGSDEIFNLIARAYIGPGDEAVYCEHGFLIYPIAIKAAGGKVLVAPEKNHTADVDAILSLIGERTRVVFLANPNNPPAPISSQWPAQLETIRQEKWLSDPRVAVMARFIWSRLSLCWRCCGSVIGTERARLLPQRLSEWLLPQVRAATRSNVGMR